MRPFKNLFFIITFALAESLASGQALIDTHAGLYTTFISSAKLQSTPGFGLEIGKRSQAKINSRLDFFTDYSLFFSTFTVKGYSFPVDASSTPVVTTINSPFFKIGLNYALGVDYFILPDQLSIGAGPALSLSYIASSGTSTDSLGAVPSDVLAMPAASTSDKLQGLLIDYGIHINAVYRLPRVQFSISYFKGFNSLTPGFSSTSSDIRLCVHFSLIETSFAKPFQNKIVK